MKFGVIVFPGSNCDKDCFHVIKNVLKQDCVYIWHKDREMPALDCVILPGGFSYGDYLRAGAIAKFSLIMGSVISYANNGGFVIGICNGFQVLLELGLLPGAMRCNTYGNFICEQVTLTCTNHNTRFTRCLPEGRLLKMPIAHAQGNYYASKQDLHSMENNGQILLKYSCDHGEITKEANPNGSLMNIAGIMNKHGNVFGLMPHPERASESILGSTDGLFIFKSILYENN